MIIDSPHYNIVGTLQLCVCVCVWGGGGGDECGWSTFCNVQDEKQLF